MGTTIIGLALLLLGAVCGGSFGLPSKFVKKETPWEALWGPFFFFVTILLPVTVFPFVAEGLFATCREAGMAAIAGPILFGFLWGLGSMTLGLSFAFIGLSLAYALNYGAQIAVGSMGPMIIHHPDQVLTSHGYVIMAGVAICLLGVVVSGRAGVLKTRSQEGGSAQSEARTRADSGTIRKGMIIAFVSGILCACYGIAFSYGGQISEIATGEPHHNPPWRASFVVSALILWGGSVSACGYCIFKLSKNRTWKSLTGRGIRRVLFIALVMACLHDGAILCFGVGASKLGDLGVGIGYAVFMSFAIIVGNVNGFITKEWKGASRQSVNWIKAGIAVLVLGVCVLAMGQRMEAASKETAATEAGKDGSRP
ncbi:MAG: L-rhamnose/proton symporter RhaT [Roseibacillus sp.]|jgi:hypothetical protein|nr:L-rhamnose/proton symporter RhaT [Roseibacillus sp.]HJM62139.1 L-rhamnose/proton symporter RhaT [Roseibacillus sp.]